MDYLKRGFRKIFSGLTGGTNDDSTTFQIPFSQHSVPFDNVNPSIDNEEQEYTDNLNPDEEERFFKKKTLEDCENEFRIALNNLLKQTNENSNDNFYER